jgi:hypothetical protein
MRIALLTLSVCSFCAASQVYNYEAYGNTLDGPIGSPSGTCTSESFVSQTLSISNCSSAPGVSTSARSLATFTALKAESTTTLVNASLSSDLFASGYARFEDILTIGSPDVQSLSMTMHLTGSLTNGGLTLARMVLSFGFDYENRVLSSAICDLNSPAGTLTFDMVCTTAAYSIALFQQHPYWFSLSTQERQNASAVPLSGSASSNFFSTATLVSVAPYDSNGQLVHDAIISSEGNGGSNFAVADAPEPYSYELFGCGMAIFGFVKYRKRRRS